MARESRAVVLLSGGLDSTTAAAYAQREGWTLYALTIRYGQVHQHEIEAARRVALALGVRKHVELAVDLSPFGGSSLTGEGEIPKDRDLTQHGDRWIAGPSAFAEATADHRSLERRWSGPAALPSTYVPARNTVFLSLALAWAEVLAAERIVIGVNALDYSGYPDCRPEFIAAFEYLASLATRAGVEGRPMRVWAPLQQLTKAAIVRLGHELGVDFALTHSCYDPGPDGRPCQRCDSCQLRARGFAEAGVPDPLLSPVR
jgi:7-cyano-7-deazaguanine synthase